MGVDRTVYLIVGRLCTPDEIEALWTQLNDMPNQDQLLRHNGYLHSISEAGVDNVLTVVGSDGVTRFPVVLHSCGWAYESPDELAKFGKADFTWYVVERCILASSDRLGLLYWLDPAAPVDFTQWERPKDPRHGLMIVHDIT